MNKARVAEAVRGLIQEKPIIVAVVRSIILVGFVCVSLSFDTQSTNIRMDTNVTNKMQLHIFVSFDLIR